MTLHPRIAWEDVRVGDHITFLAGNDISYYIVDQLDGDAFQGRFVIGGQESSWQNEICVSEDECIYLIRRAPEQPATVSDLETLLVRVADARRRSDLALAAKMDADSEYRDAEDAQRSAEKSLNTFINQSIDQRIKNLG